MIVGAALATAAVLGALAAAARPAHLESRIDRIDK